MTEAENLQTVETQALNIPVVSNSALTQAEKYAKGYCKTCDTPSWKEHRHECKICDGYTHYYQND